VRRFATALALLLLAPAAEAASPRLDELQARGTHNSYHRDPRFPGREQAGWDYSHPTLDRQMEAGVRQVELDVHWNPARDRFEVYHVWFADDRTTCETLDVCLAQLRAWSDAHPAHHPIMVMVEPKDGQLEDEDPFTQPFDAAAYDRLDEVLLEGFGPERTLTPDDVTLPGRTLRESILTKGWPKVDDVRGQVLFVLDGDDHAEPYSEGATTLAGRAMFTQPAETAPVAAFVARDGARLPGEGKYDRMRRVVRQGFMVRDLVDPDGFEAAKAGGAHFLSTDFPERLALSADPEAPSRCNPVSARAGCTDRALEVHAGGDWTSPYFPAGDGEIDVARDKAARLGCGTAGSAAATAGAPDPGCPLP
jgi:hypothetical protein